jgi:hypothetical protein
LHLNNHKLNPKDTLLINGTEQIFKVKHTTTHTKYASSDIAFEMVLKGEKISFAGIVISENFNVINLRTWQRKVDSIPIQKHHVIHRKNGFKSLPVTFEDISNGTVSFSMWDSVFFSHNIKLYENFKYVADDDKPTIDLYDLPNGKYPFNYFGCWISDTAIIEIVD